MLKYDRFNIQNHIYKSWGLSNQIIMDHSLKVQLTNHTLQVSLQLEHLNIKISNKHLHDQIIWEQKYKFQELSENVKGFYQHYQQPLYQLFLDLTAMHQTQTQNKNDNSNGNGNDSERNKISEVDVKSNGVLVLTKYVRINQVNHTTPSIAKYAKIYLEIPIKEIQANSKDLLKNVLKEVLQIKSKLIQLEGKIDENSNDEVLQKMNKIEQLFLMKISQSDKKDVRFSSKLKAATIMTYENDTKCLKTKNDSTYSSIILSNTFGKKAMQFSLQIIQLSGWICIGLGNHKSISNSEYSGSWGNKTSYSIACHPSSSHSTSVGEQYTSNETFLFGKDDIIDVTLCRIADKMKLIFQKRNERLKSVVMNVCFQEEQWEDVCFFVNLGVEGDSLMIIH